MQWLMPVISVLRKWRQEEHELKDYTVKPYL